MYFKQFYLGCLAHASYLIGSKGEAAVIDPQRDVDQYIEEAKKEGLTIKHVIETHLHADFVSGHIELAKKTDAKIYFGAKANAQFSHVAVKTGDKIPLGDVTLEFVETPGHTPESISILVRESQTSSTPSKVFTGDTLFIGDVGRPDLVGSKGNTAVQMAGMMYDSLHNILLKLPDSVEVYPAHGAGSACGKNISKETWSTIGEQRKTNYALAPMSKEAFVKMMTTDLPPAPAYFPTDAEMNRQGAAPLSELPPLLPLSPQELIVEMNKGATVLDLRNSSEFGTGHIPSSINIGIAGQFAPWAGVLLETSAPLILVGNGMEEINEARMRLARVGIENVVGFLEGGVAIWSEKGNELAKLKQIAIDELHRWTSGEGGPVQIIDVRRQSEFQKGHVRDAINIPLDDLSKEDQSNELGKLTTGKRTAVICAGGYRSSAAAGYLLQRKFSNLHNVIGGTSAWQTAGFPLEI